MKHIKISVLMHEFTAGPGHISVGQRLIYQASCQSVSRKSHKINGVHQKAKRFDDTPSQ